MAERPNILYLHSHDTGRAVQPYGRPVPTPAIQRVADEGLLFRAAFCGAPSCSGSRASLLTGQWTHSNGMMGLAHRGFALHDYSQHVLHALREGGYWSALAGEQHLATDPGVLGYDEVADVDSTTVADVAPAAVALLRRPPREPFFLSVGFFETHRKFFEPASPRDALYAEPPPYVPDTPETRADMAAFEASARSLDGGVAAVLGALEESGLAARTLVLLTTDHGLAFPGAKATLYDRGIGVMMVWRGPGGFGGGRVSDALVSQIDVHPTLCEVAGVDVPEFVQGRSLLPLVRGEVEAVNDAIFAELTYHAAYEPMRAVRTRRWKYVRRFGGRLRPVLANVDDSPSKDVMVAAGWADTELPREELHDLLLDPLEMRDVAGEERCAGVLTELRGRLDAWMRATADPLLHGDVPPPPGAVVNSPDQRSASEPPA